MAKKVIFWAYCYECGKEKQSEDKKMRCPKCGKMMATITYREVEDKKNDVGSILL